MPEAHLEDLVSSLFVDCSDRPEGVKDKCIGWFEVEIYSGLEASGSESDVWKDSFWESISIEVLYDWVDHIKPGIWIAGFDSRVIILLDKELSEIGIVDPIPLIGDFWERSIKVDLNEWNWEDVFLSSFEGCDIELMRDLMLKISLLVCP